MQELVAEFRRGIADDRPILIGVLTIWVALLALLASVGVNGVQVGSYALNLLVYLSVLVFIAAYAIGVTLARYKPERPISFLASSFVSSGHAHCFARGTPMLLALVLFMPAFSAMKSAIPLFNAYTWDDTWIRIDQAIHGTEPWRAMQPLLGHPAVTSLLSALYHLWVLLIYAGGVYFCFFQRNRELRMQYFIGYFAIWAIIGVAMAIAFASVGPCFLGPMLGNHHFDPQMAYLREANRHFPVLTLPVQDELIAWHRSGSHGLGRGITAMPSMHVALAFLFFLAMRRVSKAAGIFFGVFAAIVMVSSVHLAYHYAADGYVAIAVTWMVWVVAGSLAAKLAGGRPIPSTVEVPIPASPILQHGSD